MVDLEARATNALSDSKHNNDNNSKINSITLGDIILVRILLFSY